MRGFDTVREQPVLRGCIRRVETDAVGLARFVKLEKAADTRQPNKSNTAVKITMLHLAGKGAS